MLLHGGVLLSLTGCQPGGLMSHPRGYTAFLLFAHLLMVPRYQPLIESAELIEFVELTLWTQQTRDSVVS